MTYESDLDAERARLARVARRGIPATKDKMTLAFRCVDVPPNGREFDAFMDMLDRGREITFATFSKHVDWHPIAKEMGYKTGPVNKKNPGLRLENDHHVTFKTSRLNGETVYYMVHSAIEYVFKSQKPELTLRPRNPWN
jgi:hypothetical protein